MTTKQKKSLASVRPTKLPRWATVPSVDPVVGGDNVVEPPEQQKDDGWARKQKPPANYTNWLFNLIYLWILYLDSGASVNYGVTTGTQPNYEVTIAGVESYFESLNIELRIHATNTGAATIDINGHGQVALKKADGSDFQAGEIVIDRTYLFIHNGTEFKLPDFTSFTSQQVRKIDGAYQNLGAAVIPADNTKPQISEGAQIMSQVFTPKSATSKILVEVTVYVTSTSAAIVAAALFKDSDVDALATGFANLSAGDEMMPITFRYVYASVSTSPITFTVRTGGSAGTIYYNGTISTALYNGTIGSNMIITEYKI